MDESSHLRNIVVQLNIANPDNASASDVIQAEERELGLVPPPGKGEDEILDWLANELGVR